MSITVHAPGDRDNDTLPDDWETAHGLDPEDDGSGGDPANGVDGDPDNDGLPNGDELGADTDPTNGNSVLMITGVAAATTGVNVAWQGGVASLQYLERMAGPLGTQGVWQAVYTGHPPTPTSTNFLDTSSGSTPVFYRIRAARP